MQAALSAIERLWIDFRLPIRDALHFPDGRSYDVAINSEAKSGISIIEPFDLEEFLADDPDWTSEVDGLRQAALEDGGLLWGGEGSYGSEGFCARLTADRSLVWVIFFTNSNPFVDIHVSGNVAVFRSSSGVSIAADINDPINSSAG